MGEKAVDNQENVEIVPNPRSLKFFINNQFTMEYRRRILYYFEKKIKSRTRNLGGNYVQQLNYEIPIKVYEKNDLYYEFKNVKIGMNNWYHNLSKEAKGFIHKIDQQCFSFWVSSFSKNIPVSYYEDKYDRMVDYALENDRPNMLNFDFTGLTDDSEMLNNIMSCNGIPDYTEDERLAKVVYYAFRHDKSMLNSDMKDLTEEAYEKYVKQGESLPTPVEKKMRDSCQRSYKGVKDINLCNIHIFEEFLTLTFALKENEETYLYHNENRFDDDIDLHFKYADDPSNYEECVKLKKNFMHTIQKNMKNRGLEFYYLGVPEYHTNGNIHYHFLTSKIPDDLKYQIPSWLDYDYQKNQRRYDLGMKSWKYGKSTIEYINDKNRIVNYLPKYLLKSIFNLNETEYTERLNKQRYYKSNNLIKPDETYNTEYTEEYYDLFLAEYKNRLNGSNTENILALVNPDLVDFDYKRLNEAYENKRKEWKKSIDK